MTRVGGRGRAQGTLAGVAGLAALAALVTSTSSAAAWCRSTTTQDFTPTGAQPCDDVGKPLQWASRCVSYDVQRDASFQVDLATTRAVMQASFDAWASADCPADPVACGPGGGRGHPTIQAVDLGPVSCACAEYNPSGGNANLVIFRDAGWFDCNGTPKTEADINLALTTVTYNTVTGEIYDADIEINSNPEVAELTTTSPPTRVVDDLQSILTHEAGHFLGLAHTQLLNGDATMFPAYKQGKITLRDLDRDDVCGVCAAYPPERVADCAPAPRRGLEDVCGGGVAAVIPPAPAQGCQCALLGTRGASARDAGLGGALGALVLAVVVRRRGRKRG